MLLNATSSTIFGSTTAEIPDLPACVRGTTSSSRRSRRRSALSRLCRYSPAARHPAPRKCNRSTPRCACRDHIRPPSRPHPESPVRASASATIFRAAPGVRRLGIFDHQSFIAAGLRCIKKPIEFLRRRSAERRSADHLGLAGHLADSPNSRLCCPPGCSPCSSLIGVSSSPANHPESPPARASGRSITNCPICIQNVERQISHGHAPHHFLADFLPAQPLLQGAKRKRSTFARPNNSTPQSRHRESLRPEYPLKRSGSSGNDSVMSSRVREKIRTSSPEQCACARMPSYLSSTNAS